MKLGQHMTDEQRARCSAGQTGRSVSPGTRAKLSAALKGLIRSPESRAKNSAGHTGLVQSPETRAKRSAAEKGRIVSPETRAKLSAALKGIIRSPETLAKHSAATWKGGRKMTARRCMAKRRVLGFLPLNQYFPGSDGHHLDTDHVVFIPHTLHQSVSHDHGTGRNMEQINALALAYAGLSSDIIDDTLPFD